MKFCQEKSFGLGNVGESFGAFCVNISDVERRINEIGFAPQAAGLIRSMSTGFGGFLGLRDHGVFLKFIQAGRNPSTVFLHPVSKTQRRIIEEDIAKFTKSSSPLRPWVQSWGCAGGTRNETH